MARTFIAAFSNISHAEEAISDLRSAGYNPKEMTIMMKDQEAVQEVANDTGASTAEGIVSGATTGGVIGGLTGLLVGVGAIAIPGIGPFLAAGPLVTALGLTGAAATTVSGATSGAIAGGLIGGLMGLGLSQDEAQVYETVIKEGGVVIAVPAQDDTDTTASDILDQHGADQVRTVTV